MNWRAFFVAILILGTNVAAASDQDPLATMVEDPLMISHEDLQAAANQLGANSRRNTFLSSCVIAYDVGQIPERAAAKKDLAIGPAILAEQYSILAASFHAGVDFSDEKVTFTKAEKLGKYLIYLPPDLADEMEKAEPIPVVKEAKSRATIVGSRGGLIWVECEPGKLTAFLKFRDLWSEKWFHDTPPEPPSK